MVRLHGLNVEADDGDPPHRRHAGPDRHPGPELLPPAELGVSAKLVELLAACCQVVLAAFPTMQEVNKRAFELLKALLAESSGVASQNSNVLLMCKEVLRQATLAQ
jgi:hypothetical protein